MSSRVAVSAWYNRKYPNAGLALLTPEVVHYDHADTVIERCAEVLTTAHVAHPERFISHPPPPLGPPRVAYINRPAEDQESSQT